MAETIKSVSPTSDPDSPYYLPPDIHHPSDFSIQKLSKDEDNYVAWKIRFRSFLRVTKKFGFIDESVMYAETAHKMWEDLRRVFVPCVDLKIYQLRRRLATLRQGGDSVEEYFGKLSKVWMELSEYAPIPECKCGGCNCECTKRAEEAREKEQRYEFLMGLKLNQGFEAVTTKIMFQKPPPSLHEAFAMVKDAESMMKWYSR
ncbi:unnamed protein product [Arabidopsis thaliana]|uniref:Retrotransposon Copia-like N-terminal domain-containing protein n=1 Tax=Arabidopsis thaliana TaxID=3702 RepID=A0A654EDC0_ARATH|nr:unnamed protein product [Arabidopsis thaliana]